MMPTNLFAYQNTRHERAHSPRGYDRHEGYKPWLRDEFAFRCVYCLERELWYPDRAASFSVDHVISQAAAPGLALDYANLVYACTRCNSAKRDHRVLDPTTSAFGDHLRLGQNGVLVAMTAAGRRLITRLCLNEVPALRERQKYLRIVAIYLSQPDDARIAALYSDLFGYPHDMPDLRALRPPGGNANPGSEDTCYFARAERGELPATY